ncbi:MAG TPA: ATP-binding protein [Vicinamibacterales bacterium]|nr:ATP-binding protein [Vicinamibacterales bacterium]
MQTNQSIHRTREHLRLILKQVPGTVWATDRDLRLTYVRGQTLVDPDRTARLVGRTVGDVVRSEDPTEPAIAHHLAALAGGRQSFPYFHSGQWYDVQVEPLRDDSGAIIGCVGAAINVTDRRNTLDRLARSEARLAEAQRLAHVGSFEWSVDDDLVTWSDELRRIYGIKPGDAGGTLDAFLSRVHDDDENDVRSVMLDACHHPKAFSYEHRIVRPDGEIRWLHTAGDVVCNGTGTAQRVVGSCWDITTQHQTMDELKQSVSLLQATLDSTADGILVVDREGHVATYNQRFLTLWRIPHSFAARRDDHALLSLVANQLEEPHAFLEGVRDLYTARDQKSLDVLRFTDGRVFERYSMPQLVNGESVGRVWSFRDITQREVLLQRASFLADATRLLSSLDLNKALDAVVHLAVPYLGEFCGITLIGEPQSGSPIVNVTAGGDEPLDIHPRTLAGHSIIYARGPRSSMAVPLTSRNTIVGALMTVASPKRRYTMADLELLDELGRRVALCVDNARLYEGAQEALKGRDQFLSIAAHEIRGPLTSIHLAVQGLLRGSLSPAGAHTALEVIEREDRRLGGFVDDLLDLGRISTGQLHFDLEEVDLGTVVRDAVSRLTGTLAPTGSVTITTGGNLVGQWDRARLDQVVTNLVSNAIKYGEGKPIEITASETDGHVVLRVSDHGMGIDSSMRSKIFDAFQRASGAKRYGGLGLGLHIAKTIVNGFGGTVAVDSNPGAGSTFTVDLPVSRSANHAQPTHPGGG